MSNSTLPPTVIVDRNRGYRQWHINEIYAPGRPATNGVGQYVPNVDDSVMDWSQGLMFVTSVDYTTGISILRKWVEPREPVLNDNDDILLGAGPGTESESYVAYLDTSVMPHTLAADKRLHFKGNLVNSVKIFLGTDISDHGTIISAFYDASGSLVGENIPVELVAMPHGANKAIKAPMVAHTTYKLDDGEQVTFVAYDDQGQPVSRAKLTIMNSAFVRTTDASLKYISGIAIKTPFLSPSDPHVIEYPINMPVGNLNLMGVVTYSDGTTLEMPVDGTKFELHGLGNYVATIKQQTVPLVLTYRLSENEYSYIVGTGPSVSKKIQATYSARTKEVDGAFTVKLFAYPVWVDLLSGYRLEYFLYNLDRDQSYNVTNLVQMATNSAPFDPIKYGTVQHVSVGLNMNEVDPRFKSYRHVQTFSIVLHRPGNQDIGTNWTVGFSPGQDPVYGAADEPSIKATARFVAVNNTKLRIDCGAATLEEWLERVFYRTQPLFDSEVESKAPTPNFMVVMSGAHRVELPITAWNQEITTQTPPAEGKLVIIEFLRRTVDNDLQLGASGLIVHQIQ